MERINQKQKRSCGAKKYNKKVRNTYIFYEYKLKLQLTQQTRLHNHDEKTLVEWTVWW